MGFFGIRLAQDGADRIEDCNPAFATFFGYDSPSELLSRRPDILFESEARWKSLVAELSVPGDALKTQQIAVTTRHGYLRTATLTARLFEDHSGSRCLVGTMQVTSDEARRAWERLFRSDLGQFLHTLTSSLMSLQHVLELARDEVQEEPQPDVRPGDDDPLAMASLERGVFVLDEVAAELHSGLQALVRRRSEQSVSAALTTEAWDRLEDYRRLLSGDDTQEYSPGVRQAVLRETARMLVDTLSAWQGDDRQDLTRPVLDTAHRLRRLGTLLTIRQAEARILEMDGELSRLRDLILMVGESEQRQYVLFSALVRHAVAVQSEYARRQGLELQYTVPPAGFADREVWMEPRSVRRAIDNLIHNAIKYSWRQAAGDVFIEGLTRDGLIGLRLTSYGAPIAADEIEHVFAMGFRGRYAASRHRQGSGVGLWDSKQVAERHGGRVTLSSVTMPGVSGDPPHPHVTKVEFWIADGSGEP